jgi:hypothetical protein
MTFPSVRWLKQVMAELAPSLVRQFPSKQMTPWSFTHQKPVA